jgi:hypothetical protein
MHNFVQNSCDAVPIEVEKLVKKYTNTPHLVMKLNIDHKTRLKHVNTRFLLSLSAAGRRIEKRESLKLYFISQPKCQTLILNLFQNESTKFWLLFLHNQLDNFTKAIQCMERQPTLASEVANEVSTTRGGGGGDESG